MLTIYWWNLLIKPAIKTKNNKPDLIIWNSELKTCQVVEINVHFHHCRGIGLNTNLLQGIEHLGFTGKESNRIINVLQQKSIIGRVKICKTFLSFAPWKWVFVSHCQALISPQHLSLIKGSTQFFQYSWKIVRCQVDFLWSFSVIHLKLSRLLCTGYTLRCI